MLCGHVNYVNNSCVPEQPVIKFLHLPRYRFHFRHQQQ